MSEDFAPRTLTRRQLVTRVGGAVAGSVVGPPLGALAVQGAIFGHVSPLRLLEPLVAGKYIIVCGDSFADGSGGGTAPAMLAAAKLGLGCIVIAHDGVATKDLQGPQADIVRELVKKYGQPAGLVISAGGDDFGIKASNEMQKALTSLGQFDLLHDSTFLTAVQALPKEMADGVDALKQAASVGNNKLWTLWQGYPNVLQTVTSGPFFLSNSRVENIKAAFALVNRTEASAARAARVRYVDLWKSLSSADDVNLLVNDVQTWLVVPGVKTQIGSSSYTHPYHPSASGSLAMGQSLIGPMAELSGLAPLGH